MNDGICEHTAQLTNLHAQQKIKKNITQQNGKEK
jgi:hypothetical protein